MVKSQVLVTGCTGQVGARLVRRLTRAGYSVFGIRGKNSCKVSEINHKCIEINLIDPEVKIPFDQAEAEILVHLAWITKPQEFWNSEENWKWENASKRLVSDFLNYKGKYVVGAGSCAEYAWKGNSAISENSETTPSTSYGVAKLNFSRWLGTMSKNSLCIRTFAQYGELENSGRLIPDVIDSLLRDQPVTIQSPDSVRDFVFIDDVVEVYFRAVVDRITGILNVGTGIGSRVGDVAQLIGSTLGRTHLLDYQDKGISTSVVSNVSRMLHTNQDLVLTDLEVGILKSIRSRSGDQLRKGGD